MATNPTVISPRQKARATVTVSTEAAGVSDVIDIGGYDVVSVEMSTAWTAAYLTFNGAVSSSASVGKIYNTTAASSIELLYTTTASYQLSLDPNILSGFRYIQLASVSSLGAATAQAAARTLYLGLVERT